MSAPGDALEAEASRVAENALNGEADTVSPCPLHVQRAATETVSRGGLIADDDAQALTFGQMRRSEFLAQLRVAACTEADRELARAGRDTRGCPHLERWLAHYADRPASHLEHAIRKFVPTTVGVTSAREYIPLVSARIGQGVRSWVETGSIPTDIPAELRAQYVGGAVTRGISSAMTSVAGAVSSAARAVGGAFRGLGRLLFSEGPGGARMGVDHQALSAQLGAGRPLEGGVRSRMETAFGSSFARVRVHDDSVAQNLSLDLNAHAFTLGEHVAFAKGNYQPGTPLGDALLAHELAHVMQQGASAPLSSAHSAVERSAEEDADSAAAGAVISMYAPHQSQGVRRPRIRTGLRLSRCATRSARPTTPGREAAPARPLQNIPAVPTEEEREQNRFGPLAGAPSDWETRVEAATSAADRVELLRESLRGMGVIVVDSTTSGSSVDPDDLVNFTSASPRINFDNNLNSKTGVGGRSLDRNAGYTRESNGQYYVILGPKALEEGFYYPRVVLSHEFDHVRQYQEGSTLNDAESELDAWTTSFIRDFHRSYRLQTSSEGCHIIGVRTWIQVFDYYSRSSVSDTARDRAVRRIREYYEDTIRGHTGHRNVFRYWLHKRLRSSTAEVRTLAERLNRELGLGIDATARPTRLFQWEGGGSPESATYYNPSVELPDVD